jgi:hypothetical protein
VVKEMYHVIIYSLSREEYEGGRRKNVTKSKNRNKQCNHPLQVALSTCGENSLCASFYICFNYIVWSVLYVSYFTPAVPYIFDTPAI